MKAWLEAIQAHEEILYKPNVIESMKYYSVIKMTF